MTHILITWLILSAAFGVTAWLLPGMQVRGVGGAIIAAAVFGLLNYFIGWLFFAVIGIATLGIGFLLTFITRIVVNAILLKLTDVMTKSLNVRSFGTAVVGAILISVFGTLGEWLLRAV